MPKALQKILDIFPTLKLYFDDIFKSENLKGKENKLRRVEPECRNEIRPTSNSSAFEFDASAFGIK